MNNHRKARGYYLAHRDAMLARSKAYQHDHALTLDVKKKKYLKVRKAMDMIQVEQLFGEPGRFIMRCGHDQRGLDEKK